MRQETISVYAYKRKIQGKILLGYSLQSSFWLHVGIIRLWKLWNTSKYNNFSVWGLASQPPQAPPMVICHAVDVAEIRIVDDWWLLSYFNKEFFLVQGWCSLLSYTDSLHHKPYRSTLIPPCQCRLHSLPASRSPLASWLPCRRPPMALTLTSMTLYC